jgi:hypothetical protein
MQMTQLFLRRGLLWIAAMASAFGLGILPVSAAGNITVTVNVSVSDPTGVTYRWRSSDGQITDQDAPSTQWTLPAGPGLHFAYVLVSNGKGGYTESRIQVNTDGLSAVQPRPPMNMIAPPAPTPSAVPVPFRNWLGGGVTSSPQELVAHPDTANPRNLKVALPDVAVSGITRTNPLISESTSTSLSGDLTLQSFSPQPLGPVMFGLNNEILPSVGITCSVNGIDLPFCFGTDQSFKLVPDEVIDVEANQTNRIDPVLTKIAGQDMVETWFTGSVRLPDGSPCGTENEFFGVESSATAELVESFTRGPIPGSRVRANSWGQYSIPVTRQTRQMHLDVVVRCEDADPVTPTNSGTELLPSPGGNGSPPGDTGSLDFGPVTIGSDAPVVSSMSVTPTTIPSKFIDPADPTMAPPLPSDIVPPRPAKFLAMKGLDTRLSGCLYYKAIGAVQGCDDTKQNFLVGAVSFEDWKRAVKIDQYAPPGTQQYRAVFVNRVDLNLTRDHHSVSYPHSAPYPDTTGPTAGYVCNHVGPPFDPTSSSPTHQKDVDTAIDNAVAGKNLVACVAMDYTIAPGVNDGMPFTRFLIFGPSGDLLPSVNLDGRGEKFPPGTCTVCHGGNKYAGKFPEDGTGTADLEAHFLPFDIGNFEFSKKPGWPALRKEAQQEAIYQLNQNVLKTNANQAEIGLINGWYETGHIQNEDFFLPPGNPGAFSSDFYLKVIARSCRTCHIAQRDELSIRDLNFFKQGANGSLNPSILAELVCGQTDDLLRAYAMPNSAVTFDLFWNSNQPQILSDWLNKAPFSSLKGKNPKCTNPKAH